MSDTPVDRELVRQLYEQHGRVLLAYACIFVTDRSAAEDVLHQVFVKLLTGHGRVVGTPMPYLCRAIRNTALNHRRNHSRERGLGPEADWLESPQGLQEIAIALAAALQTLPDEQQEVIVLRIWGGLTFEEAATALDISANTAASRYRYGLAKLREQLKPL